MKTVRRPPYPKWNPGYFPCSSLTPLPLSSRRPSVSFGGFGLKENRLEPGPDFKLWMMAEVPSNVLLLDKFLDTGVDGVSIGSNDLTQLVLGVDRDNEQLATMFDERDPAVLQAIEHVVTRCVARGVTVSICGQAPSVYPELTKKLVEWGATSVSVTPDMIDETRRVLASAEAASGTT